MLVSELACVAHIGKCSVVERRKHLECPSRNEITADTDSIAHNVYQPESAVVKEVVEEFGKDILVDANKMEIDRRKLGAIVFADPSAMAKLEHIVWPHVQKEILKRIDKIQTEW